VPTFVRKNFYPKISKWQKVSYQEKKNEKVQIFQNAPTPSNLAGFFMQEKLLDRSSRCGKK
jgi:hypothetical protein